MNSFCIFCSSREPRQWQVEWTRRARKILLIGVIETDRSSIAHILLSMTCVHSPLSIYVVMTYHVVFVRFRSIVQRCVMVERKALFQFFPCVYSRSFAVAGMNRSCMSASDRLRNYFLEGAKSEHRHSRCSDDSPVA